MTSEAELRIKTEGNPGATRDMRRRLMVFLETLGIERDFRDDIQTAVGEALANAAEHAYDGVEPGEIELRARASDDGSMLWVDVFDNGTFIEREPRPGRGFGLRIARAIASTVSIDVENGTHVRMIFTRARP